MKELRFSDLEMRLQDQAKARFFDAGPQDGYVYLVLSDGTILSRSKECSSYGSE